MLLEAIEGDQLPVEYGGTGPALTEREHAHDAIDLSSPLDRDRVRRFMDSDRERRRAYVRVLGVDVLRVGCVGCV